VKVNNTQKEEQNHSR